MDLRKIAVEIVLVGSAIIVIANNMAQYWIYVQKGDLFVIGMTLILITGAVWNSDLIKRMK
jgi:hypothetical protein